MSIRRVIELPNVENFEKSDGSAFELSDCILECSLPLKSDLYDFKSVKVNGNEMIKSVSEEMILQVFDKITIDGGTSYIYDGTLDIIHSDTRMVCGVSINGWPNDPPAGGGDTYLCMHFDHVKLCSDFDINIYAENQLTLTGNPVVLNNHFYVYENQTKSDRQIILGSDNNVINAKSLDVDTRTLELNPNRVVTCSMLNKMLNQ